MNNIILSPSPSTTRGNPTILSCDSNNTNILYPHSRSIVIRNLDTPEISTQYTQHSANTTLARYSPSGYYIASADVSGNLRIWDTTNPEQLLKSTIRPFSGRINDISWDSESKRILAVGNGKDKFGHAFLFDTLSSCGEISGHSKPINSVSVRPNRPLRAVTASDDSTCNFYHAAPFKFNHSIKSHDNYVQCVRYSPSGDLFSSCGSDGKLFLYDGSSGEVKSELSNTANRHTGTIFSLSWNPDGTKLLTSGADSTVKIWDVNTNTVTTTFTFADSPSIQDQQVGCIWAGKHLVSISLSGNLNYLDPSTGKVLRVIYGHQRAITALSCTSNKSLITGSYDGNILFWNKNQESHFVASPVPQFCHSNQVNAISCTEKYVYSCGMDDLMKQYSLSADSKIVDSLLTISTNGSPKAMASYSDYVAIATNQNNVVIRSNEEIVYVLDLDFVPTALAFSSNGKEFAVGSMDGKVRLFDWNNKEMSIKSTLDKNRAEITVLSYSPDETMLAASDTNRTIVVYDTTTLEIKIHQWVFHTARINAFAWSPDSLHAASGGLDTNLEIWSVEKPMKHISIKCAHSDVINGVVFLDNNTLASASQDGFIKVWNVEYNPQK